MFKSFVYWKDERQAAALHSNTTSVSLMGYRKARVISEEYRMKI